MYQSIGIKLYFYLKSIYICYMHNLSYEVSAKSFTVNQEIFMHENIHLLNVCVKNFFMGPHESILTQTS